METVVLQESGLYSSELTDEERKLGFELFDFRVPATAPWEESEPIQAVAYRFADTDRVVKMNVPVIGGACYRHERLRFTGRDDSWAPVGSFVFPTPEQALNSVGSRRS